jgi:glyoxylase-like metal-dependent hydrolase (beta-lactamase superfamily II)
MNITHFFTYAEHYHEGEVISIQISSTLVQAGNRNILIDTGFVGHKEIVYILNKMGLSALDIHYVLNTHIHLDHVGGNRFFRHASIYLSEEEYFFQRDFMHAVSESPTEKIQDVVKEFYPEFNDKQAELYARLALEMAALWEDDIVGNTEQIHFIEEEWPFEFIEPVSCPGHTKQHYCFKILAPGKDFLITGDALPTRLSFRLYKLDFPYCYDARAYIQSQKKIGQFQGIIIPGHDKPFDTETGEYIENFHSDEAGGNGYDQDLNLT